MPSTTVTFSRAGDTLRYYKVSKKGKKTRISKASYDRLKGHSWMSSKRQVCVTKRR